MELGVKFQATANGTVSGIRFYKEPDNTGTHTGTLWTASGTELATGTFTNESTQGWEELDFSTPVTVTAGTTYVASYHTTTGHYADTSGGLSSAVTNGPLTALANGGVYAYGSSTTFPSSTYDGSNYWVDVVYTPPPSRRRFRRRRLLRVRRAIRSRLTRRSRSPSRWCPVRRRSP